MKLSSKSRYGLKAMCELAARDDQLVSISAIAGIISTSEAYLEQLMAILKRSGLVVSVRGANGGYKLAKSAADTSVGEVLRALEDDLKFARCISGECENKCKCYIVWQKLYDAINNSLDNIKLIDICGGGDNEQNIL